MKHLSILLYAAVLAAFSQCAGGHRHGLGMDATAVDSLKSVAADPEAAYWSRIHALEDLCGLGEQETARKLLPGIADARTVPERRIGYWRTAARAAETLEIRSTYVDSVRQVLLDPDAPDRTHAVEALAKLNQPLSKNEILQLQGLAQVDTNFAAFLNWAEVYLEDGRIDRSRIQRTLDGPDGRAKELMRYALEGFIPSE